MTATSDHADLARAVYAEQVQRRTVGVLSAGQVLGGIAVAGSIPAGALLAASIAGSDAAAGFAQTAGVLGAALLALPLARLALGKGRRSALAVGYAIGAVGSGVVIAGAVLSSLVLVYAGCLLVGVASAAGYQARYAATDLATPGTRARSLSWVVWAATVGAVVGPNLLNASGLLGLRLGLPELAGPYVITGAALLGAAAVLFVLLRPDPYLLAISHRVASGGSVSRPRLRDGIDHLRTRPRAILGIVIISIGHVVMVMVMVMTPVHMAHVDVTLQLIGLVISVHIAGMYAFSPLVGWAVDRFGRIQMTVMSIGVLAISCLVCAFAPADNVVVLGIGLFLLGLGWSGTLIAGSTIVTDETDPVERPAVQGLSDLAMNAAGALGGVAAGLIVWGSSYSVLCLVALVPLAALAAAVANPACREHSNARSI